MTWQISPYLMAALRPPLHRACATLLCALLWLSITPAGASPLILAETTEHSLGGHLEILVDSSNRLALKDILSRENSARFQQISGYVNRSYTNDAVWVRLSLLRLPPFPEDSYLRLWPPFLDYVDIFVQTGDDPADPGAYQEFHLGDRIPVARRPVRNPDFVVPLTLPPESPRLVYLKVRTSSSLNLAGAIHTPADLISHSNFYTLLHGGYLAIALIISLINLLFFIRLRDRLYLFFALYIFALFVNLTVVLGMLTVIYPHYVHLLSDYLVGIGAGASLIFFALFGMQLFKTSTMPWLHRFFKLMILIGVTAALSVPFGFYNRTAPLMFFWSLLSIFILSGLSFRKAFRQEQGCRLYRAAFGVSNIAYGVQFLRLLGVMPVAWWNMNAVQVGSLFNMVLMTLALTERLHAAEEKALVAAREAEQKAVELATEMTRELQDKQTDLEQALKTEHDALERQVRFVDMITHEYRTPLAIIRANLDILEMKACNAECVLSANLTKMRRAVARLVEVMEVSLARAKLNAGQMRMSRETIPLTGLIGRLLDETGDIWAERRLEFDFHNADGAIVSGDRSLLKTAFINLIDNALKYSADGDPVRVSLDADGREAMVTVRDRGRGIPADEQERVFEKYYRGAGTADTRGAGIGLYLVRRIIEQHGGTVKLESFADDGTVATVRLPLSDPGGEPDGQAN